MVPEPQLGGREAQGDAAPRAHVQVERRLRGSPAGLGRVALQNPGVQNARVSCPGWHSGRRAARGRQAPGWGGELRAGSCSPEFADGSFSPLSENLTNKILPHQIRVAPMISRVLGWGGGIEVRRAL